MRSNQLSAADQAGRSDRETEGYTPAVRQRDAAFLRATSINESQEHRFSQHVCAFSLPSAQQMWPPRSPAQVFQERSDAFSDDDVSSGDGAAPNAQRVFSLSDPDVLLCATVQEYLVTELRLPALSSLVFHRIERLLNGQSVITFVRVLPPLPCAYLHALVRDRSVRAYLVELCSKEKTGVWQRR